MIGAVRSAVISGLAGYAELPPLVRYGLPVGLIAIIPLLDPGFFVLHVFILTFIFTTFGHSWNVLGGYAGQLSLGHAVFFAVGAYATIILFVFYGVTPMIGLVVAGFVGAAVALAVGAITFRLKGHYFAMGTLALALIFREIFIRWEWVRASRGISFPFAEIGTIESLTFTTREPYFYLIGLFALIVTWGMYVIDRSKLGIYLKAINVDEQLAKNAGIQVFYYKMYAAAISGFIAGMTGGFYALYVTFVDPHSVFNLFRNVEPIIVVLIGGAGTVFGPLVGSFLFVPLHEYSRSLLSGPYTGLGWVIVGLVIIVMAIYRPGGILGDGTSLLPGSDEDGD